MLAGCEITGFPAGMAAVEIEHDSGCEVHRNAIHGNDGGGREGIVSFVFLFHYFSTQGFTIVFLSPFKEDLTEQGICIPYRI